MPKQSTEIRARIRRQLADMKEAGIRKTSCFNGGLDTRTYRANALLFEWSNDLEQARKREQQEQETTRKRAERNTDPGANQMLF